MSALALVVTLACDDNSPPPAQEVDSIKEQPWVKAAIKVLLSAYPFTEEDGNEYCGMLCKRADERVFATDSIMGTKKDCVPWSSPCPEMTTAIGTYHTQPIGPLNEGNPMRPFSPGDLKGDEPYDFIAQALTPRTKSKLDVHIFLLERGIFTVTQVHPTVIRPFPPK